MHHSKGNPSKYHTFALFHPLKKGNLMTPVVDICFLTCWNGTWGRHTVGVFTQAHHTPSSAHSQPGQPGRPHPFLAPARPSPLPPATEQFLPGLSFQPHLPFCSLSLASPDFLHTQWRPCNASRQTVVPSLPSQTLPPLECFLPAASHRPCYPPAAPHALAAPPTSDPLCCCCPGLLPSLLLASTLPLLWLYYLLCLPTFR